MRTPNAEQRAAIEHQGGVLLQAGAGSGKTFVLVEHICFLLSRFVDKYAGIELPRFERLMREYLQSIALMTFTKKAAGELSIRLSRRVEQERESSPYAKQWAALQSQLEALFVGTIHGFCFKLIAEGYFSEIPMMDTITSEHELTILLDDAFKDFLLQMSAHDEVLATMRMNKDSLLEAMAHVFSDASLRMEWENFRVGKWLDYPFEETFLSILHAQGLYALFDKTEWQIEEKYREKKWAQYLLKAEGSLYQPQNVSDLKSHWDFYQSQGRLPGKPRSASHELGKRFQVLKKYRDFLKSYCDSFVAYEEHKDGVVFQWCQWLKHLFDYLNQHYNKLGVMTYADLEYIVLKGLREQYIRVKIQQRYRYLIVDEFQDTSKIQFEIMSHVIGHDFSKIFAVGDMKQAIYGFRGGEISVFEECMKQVPQNLELKNNYRSSPRIISFNNHFFSAIFPLGPKFEGDAVGRRISLSHQKTPSVVSCDSSGRVEARASDSDAKEFDAGEAQEIFGILNEKAPPEIKTTCILYRKLAPSLELLRHLLASQMSFSAQVKIPYGEGPVLAIFFQLVEGYLSKRDEKSTLFLLNGIFRYLGSHIVLDEERMRSFYSLLDEWGPYHAYTKLLFELGCSDSSMEASLFFLRSLLSVCHDDLERFCLYFRQVQGKFLSFEFQRGNDAKRIQIMTVHAAKGLEFDRVILAGIYTNGKTGHQSSPFGKWPGSFSWKKGRAQKKFYLSPLLILEKYEHKYQNFDEGKRLLYVAATRARRELLWVDFHKAKNISGEHWICAFRANLSPITEGLIEESKSLLCADQLSVQEAGKRPFFHHHPLGFFPLRPRGEKILFLGEVSVTVLALIAQCPRKFYLRNVLRVPPKEFAQVPEQSGQFHSSIQRGEELHLAISCMIKGKEHIHQDPILQWVYEQMGPYSRGEFISERSLKFPLFGMMISGVPDLLIKDGEKTMIWDFKTGARKQEEDHYWLQLKLYAMALWNLGDVDKEQEIELSLLYLDEREKVSYVVKFSLVESEVFSFWQLANAVDQTNRAHCPFCDYGKLCRF